ncbi:MAG: hypothetical protein UV28_C0027G0002 [Candidatus Collierbacteria bacterium GW2011_GWE2_42_48]|nr:MAG: hypothetical protein UV28_C0027G0002 [Candidatus Collierbacteria bacterium GW2011_GWE2_42_48]
MTEAVEPQQTGQSKFTGLFNNVGDAETVIWNGSDAVGLSLIKEYPDNTGFKPVKFRTGKNDSVALIKIGYLLNNKTPDTIIIPLKVSISKASRHTFDHMFYDFDDPDSPDEKSVKESKASKQPIDLENTNYEYNIETNKIWDKDLKKYIDPKDLVNKLYTLHLKTINAKVFRAKMRLQQMLIDIIGPINKILIKTIYLFFGKKFKKPSSDEDYFEGLLKPYKHESLIDIQTTSEKPKILGTDFPISSNSATTFIVFITLVFLLHHYGNVDILGLHALLTKASESVIFLASTVSVLILLVDRVVPFFILLLINLLIRFKLSLMFLKISIN